jgi:hypothetical protein
MALLSVIASMDTFTHGSSLEFIDFELGLALTEPINACLTHLSQQLLHKSPVR